MINSLVRCLLCLGVLSIVNIPMNTLASKAHIQEPRPMDDIAKRRTEIEAKGKRLQKQFENMDFSYLVTNTNKGISTRFRAYVGPNRLLIESDEWVFCITDQRAFAISLINRGPALLGLTELGSNEIENATQLHTLKKTIGSPLGAVFPYPRAGILKSFTSAMRSTIASTFLGKDTPIHSMNVRTGQLFEISYSSPIPKSVDPAIAKLGIPISVNGTILCDGSNGYVIKEHQTNSSNMVIKESFTYQTPFTNPELVVVDSYEFVSSPIGRESKETFRAVFSDFKLEKLPDDRFTLAHYGISDALRKSRLHWISYLAGGIAVLAAALWGFKKSNSRSS